MTPARPWPALQSVARGCCDMNVHIEEVVASVTAVDSDALLDPAVLARIVQAVMTALEQSEAQHRRRDAERSIGCSIRTTGGW